MAPVDLGLPAHIQAHGPPLAISVGLGVDIAEYPEPGKISCAAGTWPQMRTFVFKERARADYSEGRGLKGSSAIVFSFRNARRRAYIRSRASSS